MNHQQQQSMGRTPGRLFHQHQPIAAENRKYNLPHYWLYYPMAKFLLNFRKYIMPLYLLNPADISNVYNCCNNYPHNNNQIDYYDDDDDDDDED